MKIRVAAISLIVTIMLGLTFPCASCTPSNTSDYKPPITPHTSYAYQHPSTKFLVMITDNLADDGSCSGTTIKANVLLGAKHCFVNEITQIQNVKTLKINGEDTHVVLFVFDDADHALLLLDKTFPSFVTVGEKPEVGGNIHYWGNPDWEIDILRKGYVTNLSHHMMLIDVNGFFGDSGSGIFDDNGNVVGVISDISSRTEKKQKKGQPAAFYHIKFMGALDFAFTEDQLKTVGIDPKDASYQALLGPSRKSVEPNGAESF